MYRYEPCNVGNIRKMVILLPALTPISLSEDQKALYSQIQNLPESVYLMARSKSRVKFESKVWRPVKVSRSTKLTMISQTTHCKMSTSEKGTKTVTTQSMSTILRIGTPVSLQ
jgi:hypothetical protein